MNISNNIENWMLIDGYDNYEISSFGRVRNNKTNRILKNSNIGRYYQIGLVKNKKCKHFLVHRLVAFAFCENNGNNNEVDHIDRNGLNNHFINLHWVDRSMNLKNRGELSNNTSGCKGVCLDISNNKWRASWRVNEKQKTKYFTNKEDAISHRLLMEQQNGYK
jgi:hypothetical protein